MSQRRFLIAPSLARLIRKEQGAVGRIVEGYFPARPDREHFVSIEPGHSYLVLAPARDGAGQEERTEVPRSQAEALLSVSAGKVGFECTISRVARKPFCNGSFRPAFLISSASSSTKERTQMGLSRRPGLARM